LGASGGVAAVLFAFIYFAPWQTISIWFIPVPGIIAGAGYLAYSAYMAKRGGDLINHDAHFAGAVYGFLFLIAFEPNHGLTFIRQLLNPHF
jgi:membrane associated rhomboid family serine protease